jgi:OmpA-OmpF porin, OOP family
MPNVSLSMHLSFILAATSVGTLVSDVARADENLGGYALSHFDASTAGDDFFGVGSPLAEGHLEFRALAVFDYAHEPLIVGDDQAIVSAIGYLRPQFSLALFDQLLVSLDLPVAVIQSGDSPTIGGFILESPSGVSMGDVRLGARGRIAGRSTSPFAIGLGSYIYLPSAGTDTFAGDGAVRAKPELTFGGRVNGDVGFLWSLALGTTLKTSGNPHEFNFGAGAAITFADQLVQVGVETYGAVDYGRDPPLSNGRVSLEAPTPLAIELLPGVKVRPWEGLVFGAGAGPGMSDGAGVPSVRVVALAGWDFAESRATKVERDRDGDTILDSRDACPDEAGPSSDKPERNGCPPPDQDRDRIVDSVDACPSVPGRSNADPTRHGCPPDYDRDGIADNEDACPNQKGLSSAEPSRNGCPGDPDGDGDGVADRSDACPQQRGSRNDDPTKNGCPTADGDGDGIADLVDACPSERGFENKTDPTKNGCPREVRVTTGEIVILRQVQFRVGESSLEQTVDPISDDLLTEVRDVIVQHPEIERIEVQGHADDTGTADFNKRLSLARAEAVRAWLIKKGIDSKRLHAQGFGATRPVAPNTSDIGRQRNRRVEFSITKQR